MACPPPIQFRFLDEIRTLEHEVKAMREAQGELLDSAVMKALANGILLKEMIIEERTEYTGPKTFKYTVKITRRD